MFSGTLSFSIGRIDIVCRYSFRCRLVHAYPQYFLLRWDYNERKMMSSFKNKPAVFLVLAVGLFAVAAANAHAAVSVVSAKVTGPNAVTIVYSEPVTTVAGDYGNFNGSLSDQNLLSVMGSGTNTVTLNFSGTPMPPSASGYVTIGANVNGVSDNSYLGGGTYQVTDGQPPTLSAISIMSDDASGTFSGTGSTVTVTFSMNEPVTNPSITIAGHSVSLTGGGQGPWSASYTMRAGDSPNAIPINLTVSDMAANQLQATFSTTVGATAVNGAPMPTSTVAANNSLTPTSTPSATASSSMSAELELRVLESQLAKLQLQQTAAASAAVIPPKYKFTGLLDIGSAGAAVTALQKLLTSLGFYSGPVTGKYGVKTAAAVRKYQSAHGVAAKGYVGPGTRALLNAGK
jgi:Putative peptidoglycan binding domain